MTMSVEDQKSMLQTEIDNLRAKLVELEANEPETFKLVRHAHENKIIQKTIALEALDPPVD